MKIFHQDCKVEILTLPLPDDPQRPMMDPGLATHALTMAQAPLSAVEDALWLQQCTQAFKRQVLMADQAAMAAYWAAFQQVFTLVEAAGGLVEDPQRRLLVIHRRGRPDLPKGKMEPGESAPEAALREVREETGLIDLKLSDPLEPTYHVYQERGNWFLKITYWYRLLASDNQPLHPQAEEDITAAMWCEPRTLATLQTFPSLMPLLRSYWLQYL